MLTQKTRTISWARIAVVVIALGGLAGSIAGCGGGGGGGATPPPPPPTYSLSGSVTSAVTGAAVANVTVTLSGAASASTATDASGRYSFSRLANGGYTVSPSLPDAVFTPVNIPVTINGANLTGQDFLATGGAIVASDVEFLPQWFSTAEQLRASLVLADGNIVFTDSSDYPLKKRSLSGSSTTPLARRFGVAEGVALQAGRVYWIEGGRLHETAADGTTRVLVEGSRTPGAEASADILLDFSNAYWVDEVPTLNCSPPCTWIIQQVPLDGRAPVTLATVNRKIVALAQDANNIYWEEASLEPLDPGCNCGSKIRSVSKAGGAVTTLVDGWLNGTLPSLPPGYIPASWLPTGGIAVTPTEVLFAIAGDSYQLKAVSLAGDGLRTLATVPTSAGMSLTAIRDLSVSGSNAYWIDSAAGSISTVPVAGGAVSVVASDIGEAGALALEGTDALWTDGGVTDGCCARLGTGSIKRVPLAGGAVSTVIAGLDRPRSIAVADGRVAWADAWRVGGATSAGAGVTTRVSGIAGNMVRIAIAAGKVFILDGGLIKVVPLAGGSVEKLASAHFGAIDDFSLRSDDIATDGTSVYWTVQSVNGAPSVQKVAVAGGTPVTIASHAGTVYPQDCYRRIVVVPPNVYWSAGSEAHPIGCTIKKVAASGGPVTTLVDQAYMGDFTVDTSHVYFSEFLESPSLLRMSVDGGLATTVAPVAAWVLTNDSSRVYWLDLQRDSIAQLSKTSGGEAFFHPVELWMDPYLVFEAITVGPSGIYCTETQTGSIYAIF